MEIKLPTKKMTATYVDPHIMLFYGPPKVGKTTVLSQLDDCLIIDLEDGTKYLDSMRVQVIGLKKPVESDKALAERQEKNHHISMWLLTRLPSWKNGVSGKVQVCT
jgi:replication-associated recombination protein RarA